MCKTCPIKNLRYPLLRSFIMLGYLKKLLKKSLRWKERHPFGKEKTHSPSNRMENQVNINQANTPNTALETVNSREVKEIPSETLGSEPELILYKFDACPYCKRVQRKIIELNISDKIEMRDTRTEPMWRKDLNDRTGRTQVPCMFIDGEPMFESLDIIDYLQMQFTSTS